MRATSMTGVGRGIMWAVISLTSVCIRMFAFLLPQLWKMKRRASWVLRFGELDLLLGFCNSVIGICYWNRVLRLSWVDCGCLFWWVSVVIAFISVHEFLGFYLWTGFILLLQEIVSLYGLGVLLVRGWNVWMVSIFWVQIWKSFENWKGYSQHLGSIWQQDGFHFDVNFWIYLSDILKKHTYPRGRWICKSMNREFAICWTEKIK